MDALMAWIAAHSVILLSILGLIVNEVFAANPNLKSNSLVQFLLSLIGLMPKSVAGK